MKMPSCLPFLHLPVAQNSMVARFDASRCTLLRVTLIAPVGVSTAVAAASEACGESSPSLPCGESVAAEVASSMLHDCDVGSCGDGK